MTSSNTMTIERPSADQDIPEPLHVLVEACPRAGGCALTGQPFCPDNQALIDTCPSC